MNAHSPAPHWARHASLLPDGALPEGDRRFWAHTLTDVVAGFLRDADPTRIAQHDGRTLALHSVLEAGERLRAAGVRPGDVVLVECHNEVAGLATLLACWLEACCVCPIDPATPADVKALIATESGATAQADSEGAIRPLPRTAGAAHARPSLFRLRGAARVTGSDLALLIFTSGSSGTPKGVMLSHLNVMSALRSLSAYLELRADDRILTIPPLFFDYGLYQLLLALFDGCGLMLSGRHPNIAELRKQIVRHEPSVLPVVPALASGLARLFETLGKTASSVRLVTNTGGHLSDATIAALESVFPQARIMPMYGLTECKRALFLDRDRFPGRAGSVGRAMPGLEAVVAIREDGELREAPPSVVGELYVRGPSVMQGYHGPHVEGGARIEAGTHRDDNWLATGDLFATDEDGLLYFRGRSKMLIKQGGFCIHPRDVEVLAEALDDIETARVVGRQEADGDESAVLFAQVRAEMPAGDRKRLLQQLKDAIPRTLMPREVRFVQDWPATPNGKIDARALERMAARGVEAVQ
jgi:acyl-CoA synthetase (AMP-forming)/AMP-acid ligase II